MKDFNKPETLKLLKELSNLPAPSGFEGAVLQYVKSYNEKNNLGNWEKDSLNNGYIFNQDRETKPLVSLDSHTDEVGFMVQAIKANGLIQFLQIGGWVVRNLPAMNVLIRNNKGEWIPGIIGTKPPHFSSPEERDKVPSIEQLTLDVGASSASEVEKLGIELGAPIVPEAQFKYQEITNTVWGKAFDNRFGVASTLQALTYLKDKNLAVSPVGVFSSQEEVGIRGATVSVNRVKPRLAIVLEGTPSDDFFITDDVAQGRTHHGVQIRQFDPSYIPSPHLINWAKEIAQKSEIPFQMAVRRGGGTNAKAIHLAGEGVPTIILSAPVRYAHAPCGISSLKDYDAMRNLVIHLVQSLTPDFIESLHSEIL